MEQEVHILLKKGKQTKKVITSFHASLSRKKIFQEFNTQLFLQNESDWKIKSIIEEAEIYGNV